ncbi:hypothetical protein ACTWPB_17955 [Nocardia sp. IBHARD005]|uniref:hypothetical protein n=1 Tax=Nocardia sp. IBHARD005 TaxID=3457765 RepID=UPI00405A1396
MLLNRSLRPRADHEVLSRFGQVRWDLSPAVLQCHSSALAVDFAEVPDNFRLPVKQIAWLLLNAEPGQAADHRFRAGPLSVSSVQAHHTISGCFSQWLNAREITRFADVSAAHLDAYAVDVRAAEMSHGQREDLLAAVVRAWCASGSAQVQVVAVSVSGTEMAILLLRARALRVRFWRVNLIDT